MSVDPAEKCFRVLNDFYSHFPNLIDFFSRFFLQMRGKYIETDQSFYTQIMLDVRDFAEGSVSVRALGENELVVEGIIQKKEESSPSENCKSTKSCSRSFQQRFMFPGLQVEGVTSSVSSDGVMTITAPRIVSVLQNIR